jgi:hypothetical protein
MLPIRLGMLNAQGDQDLIVYALSRKGRIETTNYRTVKLPTGSEIPPYVKDDFTAFYKALFTEQVRKENHRAVFTEYFWNMSSCDPCSADPLSRDELKKLGVFWLDEPDQHPIYSGKYMYRPPFYSGGTYLTRLHVRYSNDTFPEDLMFQETSDQETYQGRYVLRHPYSGDAARCEAGREYEHGLYQRKLEEARTLAQLTGWDLASIREKSGANSAPSHDHDRKWWKNLWN